MAEHEKIFLRFNLASFILFPSKASKTWLITLKDMTDPDLVLKADKKSELVWFTFLKESDIHILGKLYYQHL